MAASLKVSRVMQLGLGRSLLGLKPSFSKVRCLRQQNLADLAPAVTWQLHSGVLLQRHPVVSAELNRFEQDYNAYLNDVETNNSLLSDHELYDRQNKQAKTEPTKVEAKGSQEVLLTAKELEDEWQKERDQFSLADRTTDSDRNKDMTSTNRKLDEKLFLIVNQKWSDNGKPTWMFPQVQRKEGESMRETGERALRTNCGEDISASFLGNAPCAYKPYKLPRDNDDYGVKLYIFKADYRGGNIVPNPGSIVEYKWVTRTEMREYLDRIDMELYEDLIDE